MSGKHQRAFEFIQQEAARANRATCMKTVWKFPFAITRDQPIDLPACAEVIHVGLDPEGAPCLWAKVDPTQPKVEHSLHVTGTGHPIPDGDNRHLGSFNQGPFVWHVWMPC